MTYSELQHITLSDGRDVVVLEVFAGGEAYLVEQYTPDGDEEYEIFTVKPEQISGAA